MLLRASLAIGVLDPKHVSAAGVPGIEPVEERSARSTDVQVPGGRWGETDPRLFHSVNGKRLRVNGGGRPVHHLLLILYAVQGETEREGFEPSIGVDPLCRFSKPVPSATRPPLQRGGSSRAISG